MAEDPARRDKEVESIEKEKKEGEAKKTQIRPLNYHGPGGAPEREKKAKNGKKLQIYINILGPRIPYFPKPRHRVSESTCQVFIKHYPGNFASKQSNVN